MIDMIFGTPVICLPKGKIARLEKLVDYFGPRMTGAQAVIIAACNDELATWWHESGAIIVTEAAYEIIKAQVQEEEDGASATLH